MASDYPASLDAFDTIASDKKTSDAVGGRTHRDMHNDLGDAIEHVQAELGTDPAGTYATVKARFEAIEGSTLPQIDAKGDILAGTADNTYDNVAVGSNDTVLIADSSQTAGVKWGAVTAAQIAANAVGASELADNAVDTNAIANAQVTAAKLAADVQPAMVAQIGNLFTAAQATPTAGAMTSLGNCTEGAAGVFTCTSKLGSQGFYAAISYVTVVAGEAYTAVSTLSPVGRPMYAQIEWRDAAYGVLGFATGNTVASGATEESRVTGVAPATATKARLYAVFAPATGVDSADYDSVTVTHIGFWKGVGGRWTQPGVPVVGMTPADGSVATATLADGAVTAIKIADGAVTADKTDGQLLPTVSRAPAVPNPTQVTISDGDNYNVLWMSDNQRRLYASRYNHLWYSEDDGGTWVDTVYNFGAGIQGIRELDNGEMLCATQKETNPGDLFLSSGFPTDPTTATWTKVLSAGAGGVGPSSYFEGLWGMSVCGPIVVVSEYGGKVEGDTARFVYLSDDYGATWEEIYDLGDGVGSHIHGCAYDPWWDAIWVVKGDTNPGEKIIVSFDRGDTWDVVLSAAHQSVCIVPMPTCVLFGTDSAPNGILRIDRSKGKTGMTVDVAHTVSGSGVLDHLATQPFQARIPGAPLIIPFAPVGSGHGIIVATYDGWAFTDLWTDTATYVTGKGPQTLVGPTLSGIMTGMLRDDRQASASRLTMPAPMLEPMGSVSNARLAALEARIAALEEA